MRTPQLDPNHLIIALDPEAIERGKAQRAYHLNVIQVPTLRLLGFCLLAICILFHNLFLLKSFSWLGFLWFTSVIIGYALISWVILYIFFDKPRKYDLGFVFLVVDVFIWTLAIYFSGGEKSLFFWLMVMRVADQINTNFKRVFFFAHLSIANYIGMLLYLMYVDHRTISLLHELPKILAIYSSNLYIAMAARASEEHRNRTATAVRV